MDPSAVAAYYRGKGYVVRDGARVTGPSGIEHKVPLLAEGPLGSLAVFFGDFGGVDGPEMGGARKVAREVGATPVLAADEFSNQDRQVAAKLGVVLLDGATLAGDGGGPVSQRTGMAGTAPPLGLGADTGRAWPGLAPIPTRRAKPEEPEPHPWPASGRVGGSGEAGPAPTAVDIDEILAPAQPAPAAAKGSTPRSTSPAPSTSKPGPAAEAPASPIASADDEGLWKRPRGREAPAAPRPRAPGSQRFAWLGADVPPAPAPKAGASPLAVEYDDVVPARAEQAVDEGQGASDGSGEDVPLEKLGEPIELQPTMEEVRRRADRDRLMRRLFWILFAAVLLYLFVLWWT